MSRKARAFPVHPSSFRLHPSVLEVVVLYSMTGYGEASYSGDTLQLAVELRAVNNRYLKVSLRAAEPYNLLEPEVEKVVRRSLKRGTIQGHMRCPREGGPGGFPIKAPAPRRYLHPPRQGGGEGGGAAARPPQRPGG